MRKKGIITSAIVLTVAGIITRLLGFVYRIYMSNTIGAEGMGLYQMIMPLYGLAWSIACSGFTTTVSKLTAQEKAKGENGNVSRILKICVAITAAIGIIIGVAMYLCADYASVLLIKDTRTRLPLQILAAAIPFMAAGSCLRGYFFGMQEPIVPAVNQVLEQLIRMTVIYLLAGFLVPLGLEFACVAAILGIVAEEFFSLIYIIIAYKRHKSKIPSKMKASLPYRPALTLILSMALPLTANRVVSSLLSTFENLLIPQRLQLFGYSINESIGVFGKISGMAMPLIFFPSAFLVSLSISLVPAVSESLAVRNLKRIQYTASRSLLFASVIGFLAAGVFVSFSGELGYVIYKQDIGQMLLLMGVMCPFLYMQVVLSGILNGLGYQVFLFRNSIISSLITIGAVYFFVPFYGITAFIMGWFASLIVVCGLELFKLRKSVELHFEFSNWFVKPVISALASGLLIRYLSNTYIFSHFGYSLGLVISISIMICMYIAFVIATGCLSSEDFKNIAKNVRPVEDRK